MEQKITYPFYRTLIDNINRKMNLLGSTWSESDMCYAGLVELGNIEGTSVKIETTGPTSITITKC